MADPTDAGPPEAAITGWLRAVCAELGLAECEPSHAEIKLLLDLARDAAHHVERPAAPLTTFLAGVAVGRGASVAETTARASALALARDGSPQD